MCPPAPGSALSPSTRRARARAPERPRRRPLPSRLGDDHLGADFVEALPELCALQVHPRRLRRGQRRAGPRTLGGASGGSGRGGRQEGLLAAACGESGGSQGGRGSADLPTGGCSFSSSRVPAPGPGLGRGLATGRPVSPSVRAARGAPRSPETSCPQRRAGRQRVCAVWPAAHFVWRRLA